MVCYGSLRGDNLINKRNPKMIPPQQHILHDHTLSEKIIWWLVHHMGAPTILTCIIVGACIIIPIIFKDRFGEIITAIKKANKKE